MDEPLDPLEAYNDDSEEEDEVESNGMHVEGGDDELPLAEPETE